jgi:hypothetical protein
MRSIAIVLTLVSAALLLGQSSSTYRVTHTYTLGGTGAGTTSCPIHLIIGCLSRGRIA